MKKVQIIEGSESNKDEFIKKFGELVEFATRPESHVLPWVDNLYGFYKANEAAGRRCACDLIAQKLTGEELTKDHIDTLAGFMQTHAIIDMAVTLLKEADLDVNVSLKDAVKAIDGIEYETVADDRDADDGDDEDTDPVSVDSGESFSA
jgi:hypothetical protein